MYTTLSTQGRATDHEVRRDTGSVEGRLGSPVFDLPPLLRHGILDVMGHSDAASESGDFRRTRWSLVLRALQSDSTAADDALADLCESYWKPVHTFICSRGYTAVDAEDLTQEFFARVIERQFIHVADPERGRFRAFLLTCVKHFLSNEKARQKAVKRGGQVIFISLDADGDGAIAGPVNALSPEECYDHKWATTLLKKAIQQLQLEYATNGKAAEYERLEPLLTGAKESSYQALAQRLGITEENARQTASRFRRRYGEIVRSVLADTVSGPQEFEDEFKNLRSILSKAHFT